MNQTGYLDAIPFARRLGYNGGFCEWWFTPWQNITSWPDIDPANQYLDNEPSLATGATWFGPMKVPDSKLGFEEIQQVDKAGIYYKQKVNGFYPGDSGNSRVNLENLPHNRYAVVGRMRAGGMWLLLGNEEYGLDFLNNYKSGEGVKGTAGSEFSFGYDSLYKAAVLPVFLGLNVTPPDDGTGSSSGGGAGDDTNNKEVIPFENVSTVNIEWTDSRKQAFGAFPLIQVWFDDTTGGRYLANVNITVDVFPPLTNMFTVNNSGPATGIVVIV